MWQVTEFGISFERCYSRGYGWTRIDREHTAGLSPSQLAIAAKTLRSVGVNDYKTVLTCIAHRVGRIKSATNAGTAQTWIARCDTVWCGSAFDWQTPLRRSSGLLGPAYNSTHIIHQGIDIPRSPMQSIDSNETIHEL